MNRPIYFRAGKYILLLLISIFFISIFSIVASPFTFRYVGDSSIFMMLGKLFVSGKIPYVDYFDHKGPALILVQAIGQFFFTDRFGVFLIEVINLFFVLVLIDKMCRIVSNPIIIPAISSFLFLFSLVMTGGNTSEEFCLVPLFYAGLVMVRYFYQQKAIGFETGFLLGLSFSFIFWIRLNNAGLIVSVCIFLFVQLLLNKQYVLVRRLIISFILGQIPFTLLFLVYFQSVGGFSEMIYAAFLFNMKYVNKLFSLTGEAFYLNYLSAFLFILGSWLYNKKFKDKSIWLFSSIAFFINYLTVNIGYAYSHYYILMLPFILFYIVLLLSCLGTKLLKWVSVCSLILLLGFAARKGYYIVKDGNSFKQRAQENRKEITNILDMIPDAEKNKIYYYGVDPNFYLLANVVPNYKFFVLQEWHGDHDQDIFTSINQMMKSENPPLWFFSSSPIPDFKNMELIRIIDQYYTQVYEDQSHVLFRKKETYHN